MQRWKRARLVRMVMTLGVLSMLLSACDSSDLLDLLGGGPAAEAPAPDDEAPAPDEAADDEAPADDDAADDEAPADDDAADDEAPADDDAPAEDDAPADDGAADDAAGLSAVEQEIFDTLNETRSEAGLEPLALSAEISAGAREYSCTMAETGVFEHADIGAAGVNGENIAYGYGSAAAVHEGWMNSPGHRDNRMNDGWTEYGVGVCEDGDGVPYYTERFR